MRRGILWDGREVGRFGTLYIVLAYLEESFLCTLSQVSRDMPGMFAPTSG